MENLLRGQLCSFACLYVNKGSAVAGVAVCTSRTAGRLFDEIWALRAVSVVVQPHDFPNQQQSRFLFPSIAFVLPLLIVKTKKASKVGES